MTVFIDRIKSFFSSSPSIHTAVQFNPGYISGIQLDSKSREIKNYFIQQLEPGMIRASFTGKNIADPKAICQKLSAGLKEAENSEGYAAVLMPEICQKSFVLPFDKLPKSPREQEEIIRFRIKKQMPVLSENTRLSFDVLNGDKVRVIAVLARRSVIEEYEDLIKEGGLKVGMVGVPIISLANLIDRKGEKDFLLVSIEEGSHSMIASVRSEVVLCRQKASVSGLSGEGGRINSLIQDIENTMNFIEDHESKRIDEIWIRMGLIRDREKVLEELISRFSCPVRPIESRVRGRLPADEKDCLSPMFGQLL